MHISLNHRLCLIVMLPARSHLTTIVFDQATQCLFCCGIHPVTNCCCGLPAEQFFSERRLGLRLYSCQGRHCMYAAQRHGVGSIIYSFESDYLSLCRHNINKVGMCQGATDTRLQPLFTVGLGGIANSSVIEGCDLRSLGYSYIASRLDSENDVDGLLQELQVKSYVGQFNCIRSVFCTGTRDCKACSLLVEDREVLARAMRKADMVQSLHTYAERGEDYSSLLSRVNPDYLNATEMVAKVKTSSVSARKSYKDKYNLRNENAVLVRQTAELKASLGELRNSIATGTDDWPDFLRLLKAAHEEGED